MIQAISIFIIVLISSSCHHMVDNNMRIQTLEDNQSKPQDTSGYASVNGLKMYNEIHGKELRWS